MYTRWNDLEVERVSVRITDYLERSGSEAEGDPVD